MYDEEEKAYVEHCKKDEEKNKRKKILQLQIVQTQSYITYWNAMVVSGGYKQREVGKGCGSNEDGTIKFRPMTDEELLSDSLSVLQSHVKRLWDLTDKLMEYTGS